VHYPCLSFIAHTYQKKVTKRTDCIHIIGLGQNAQQQQQPGQDAAQKDAAEPPQQQQQQQQESEASKKLAAVQAELERLRKEHQEKENALKMSEAQIAKLNQENESWKYATSMTIGTDNVEQAKKIADEHRHRLTKECHAQAHELLPTFRQWAKEAPPDTQEAMDSIGKNIARFVGADGELINNEQRLKDVMRTTRVFATIKDHTEKQVATAKAETEAAQQELAQTKSALQSEQQKHAQTANQLAEVQRRIDLLEQTMGSNNNRGASTPTAATGNTNTTAPVGNSLTAPSPFPTLTGTNSLFPNGIGTNRVSMVRSVASATAQPGDKRDSTQARLDIKKSQASATAGRYGGRNVRPKLYDGDHRLGPCPLFQEEKYMPPLDPMLGTVFDGLANDLAEQGMSTSFGSQVEWVSYNKQPQRS
jgi:predicted  nucleic acid-binding Zn-ribbon protein